MRRPTCESGRFLDEVETYVYNQGVVQRVAPPAAWRRCSPWWGDVEVPAIARRGPTRTPDRGFPRRGHVLSVALYAEPTQRAPAYMPGEVMTSMNTTCKCLTTEAWMV